MICKCGSLESKVEGGIERCKLCGREQGIHPPKLAFDKGAIKRVADYDYYVEDDCEEFIRYGLRRMGYDEAENGT